MNSMDIMEMGLKFPKIVTEKDYFIATKGTFELSNQYEYNNIDSDEYISESGSRYKVKGDYLYRRSDHWGKVATCSWYFPYLEPKTNGYILMLPDGRKIWVGAKPTLYGKIRFSELERKEYAVEK